MTDLISLLWQYNLELSFILIAVLVARFAIRKTTKNYNAYLLWLAIPVGYGLASLLKNIEFNPAKSETLSAAVQTFSVLPKESNYNYSLLGWVWLLVAFVLIVRLAWQHKQLRTQLKKQIVAGNIEYPNSEYPVVTIDNKELSPAVYGFVFPKIYFPIHVAQSLTERQRLLIIEHEQHHIKQKHLWLNLLWDLAVCLAWFNPLIYISRQQFRHDQELFCDYLVLNKSATNQSAAQDQKAYGHALLSTVSATASVSLLCSWKMFNQLEERIMNISKPMSFSGKLALLVGSTFIIGCSAVYAANKDGVSHSDEDGITIIGVTRTDSGEHYITDEAGNKRLMTKEEIREFERAHEEMESAHLEMESAHEEMELAQKEIERAHEEMENSFERKEISAEQRAMMEREFEQAQEEMEKAHEEMEKAQREMEKEMNKLEVQAPKAPKKPKNTFYRVPPKPPAAPPANSKLRKAPKAAEPVKPTKAVAPVVPVKTVPPAYPASAMKSGTEGFVRFEFDVKPSGELMNLEVVESSPVGVFEEAAEEAIRQWTFSQSEGVENLTYTLDFVLG